MDRPIGDNLVLQVLVVLTALVGDGAHFFRRLFRQIVVGRGIGESNVLAGSDPDLALEQDQVFLIGVLRVEQRLLLGLELDARPQLIEIRCNAGLVRRMGMIEQHLILGQQRFGVVHLAGGGNGVEIGGGHLLHNLAARCHFGEMRRALGRAGGFPSGNYRAGEERFGEVDLTLGEIVLGNQRNSGGHAAAGKDAGEFFDDAGPESLRGQIVLMDADLPVQRDGRQKLLKRFALFAVNDLFVALDLFQSQVALEAAAHGVVERELQGFVGRRLRGHAAVIGIGGGRGILRVGGNAK